MRLSEPLIAPLHRLYENYFSTPLIPQSWGKFVLGDTPKTPGRENPAPLFGQPEDRSWKDATRPPKSPFIERLLSEPRSRRNARGSYVLLIYLDTGKRIEVGKLGVFDFPHGYYLYAGSALGGLRARVKRHFRKEKKLHWHIDYLLEQAKIIEVWAVLSEERLECHLARAARTLPGATVPVSGFGSSDCRCPAHLVHLPDRPQLEDFQTAIGKGVTLELLSNPDAR